MVKNYQSLLLAATMAFFTVPANAMDDMFREIREEAQRHFLTIQQEENNDPVRIKEKARHHLNAINEKINRKNKKSKGCETGLCEMKQMQKDLEIDRFAKIEKINEENGNLALKINSQRSKCTMLNIERDAIITSDQILSSGFQAYAWIMRTTTPMREKDVLKEDTKDIRQVSAEIFKRWECLDHEISKKESKILQLNHQVTDNNYTLEFYRWEEFRTLENKINDLTSKHAQLLDKLKNLKVTYEIFENLLKKYRAEQEQQNK